MVICHPGTAKLAFPGTEPNTQNKKVSVCETERDGEGKKRITSAEPC